MIAPDVKPSFDQLFISWTVPLTPDLAGVAVWLSPTSGFDPAATTPVYDGLNTIAVVPAASGQPFYLRIGAYDTFGRDQMNISAELEVQSLSSVIDTEAPEAPDLLDLTTRTEVVDGKVQRLILVATVPASAAADFAYFDYEIKQEEGNYVGFSANSPSKEWSVLPVTEYTVKVRAVDQLGNASGYSATQTIVTPDVPDLAHLINTGETKIGAHVIQIDGQTLLSDWRFGGDTTLINGGKIAANTLLLNSAAFGLRGITVEGLEFEPNAPGFNNVAWSSGTIVYTGDDGNIAVFNIAAGSTAGTSGTLFLFYEKGTSVLTATTSVTEAFSSDAVVLATYKGNLDLVANYGRTIIDGGQIKSIMAAFQQADIDSLRTGILIADAIKSPMIAADAVSARNMVISDTTNLVPDTSSSPSTITGA